VPAILVSAAGTMGGCATLFRKLGSPPPPPPPPPPGPPGFGGPESPSGGCLLMVQCMLALTWSRVFIGSSSLGGSTYSSCSSYCVVIWIRVELIVAGSVVMMGVSQILQLISVSSVLL